MGAFTDGNPVDGRRPTVDVFDNNAILLSWKVDVGAKTGAIPQRVSAQTHF